MQRSEAAEQLFIRRIDDGIRFKLGDVSLPKAQHLSVPSRTTEGFRSGTVIITYHIIRAAGIVY